jgi:hypothetical protein
VSPQVYAAVAQKGRAQKKSACKSRRQVIEAGFIQARNLSSSEYSILFSYSVSKLKIENVFWTG